jgi:hypothetical protein
MKQLLKSVYHFLPFKQPLFTLIKKFYVPSERIYKHLHFRGDIRVSIDKEHAFLMRHYGQELENLLFGPEFKAVGKRFQFPCGLNL